MIEKTTAYKVGEKFFSCIEEAQKEELAGLFNLFDLENQGTITGIIMDNADRIMDILTMTPSSKPKARAINGGRKPRKAKTVAEPEQVQQA